MHGAASARGCFACRELRHEMMELLEAVTNRAARPFGGPEAASTRMPVRVRSMLCSWQACLTSLTSVHASPCLTF